MTNLIFLCIFVTKIGVIWAQNCKTINGTINKVVWPTTKLSKTTSNPPCLNIKREFLYRECTNGEWGTEPTCIYLQMKSLPQCPENFTEAETFCWSLSPKSTFLPECPFKDVIPFASYESVITEPVWMPVKRDTDNGLGLLLWIEPTTLYKTYFNKSYIYEGSIKDKNCVVYHNSSYIVAVSCNDAYPRICAYYKLNHLSTQLCGAGYICHRGDFNPDSKCYCLGKTSMVLHKKAEFLKAYQNNIYGLLTNDTCSIGLEKNGTYIWSNSQQEVDYTFWSSDVVFDNTHTYVASTPQGWILTQYEETCYIFEKDPQLQEPFLDLQLNNSTDLVFNLKITNTRALKLFDDQMPVYCFSNAWPSLLPYRYPSILPITVSEKTSFYEFYPYEDSGDYWCESYTYLDVQLITTKKLTIEKNNYFVAIMLLEYSENFNPLSQDIINFFDDVVFSKLVDDNHKCRFRKIVQLDDQKKQVWVNVHITSSSQEDEIKDFIVKAIQEIPLSLVELKSSQFCYEETVDGLTWKKTEVGKTATPTHLCLTSKGEIVTRSCIVDDYVDGAYWSEAETCILAEYSSLTQELYDLTNSVDSISISKVVGFSEKTDQLNYVDIYLISNIFLTYEPDKISDFFITAIDNVMNIDEDVLKESQSKFNTTGLFLQRLDSELQNYPKEQNKTNFAIRPTTTNMNGLIVQKINNSFDVENLFGFRELEDILQQPNLDSGLWISLDLLPSTNINLTFVVVHKDGLYKEDSSSRTISSIFKVTGESLNYTDFGPAFLVQKINPDEIVETNCSQWSNKWEKISDSRIDTSFLVCEYEKVIQTSFAITTAVTSENNDQDVTDILKDLLESNISSSLIMEKLHNTTRRYKEFEPNDVYLVGKILEKVSDYDNINLDDLTQVVSNLHEIDNDILFQSQTEKMATDSVLHYIDQIIQNHNYKSDVKIFADNFVILIFHAKSNISGLALLNDNKTTEALTLEGDVSSKDVAKIQNLECAAFLNPQLKNQLSDDAKIIITVFSKNGLFVDKSNSTVISKIFGVILPNVENFQAPVSIVHNIVQLNQEQCVYWYYNTSSNITGFWKNDNRGSLNKYSLIQCDFWHTTHFGLLLLDEDLYSEADDILSKISLVNCIVSFIGIGIIFLTAVLFKKWRSNTGNQVLLNFAFAVALQITIFYVSDSIYNSHDYVLCTIIGTLLHYTIISQFFWMLIVAFFQYKRFVTVMGTHSRYVLLKSCLFGWLLPLIPVLTLLIFDEKSYVKGKIALCYPSGLGLYLGVWFPVLIVIAANLFIYIIILTNVVRMKSNRVCKNTNESKYELRLAIFLFFMLGLTWIFGFLGEFNFGLVFVYLFSITATLQGYVLFLFFILFNLNTRYMYLRALERVFRRQYLRN